MTNAGEGIHIHAPPARGYQAYVRYRSGRRWFPLLDEPTEDSEVALQFALAVLSLPRVAEVQVCAIHEYYDPTPIFHAKRLK